MKNSSDTMGNRTRDLLTCSTVPQLTAPPRAPIKVFIYTFLKNYSGLILLYFPPSLLYNGYRVFPGGKLRPGRAADHSPPSSADVLEE